MMQKSVAGDTDTAKLGAEMAASLSQASELWTRSFDHHDKKGDGVLDEEEASNFFPMLLREAVALLDRVAEIGCRASGELMIRKLRESSLPDAEKEAAIAARSQALEETMA